MALSDEELCQRVAEREEAAFELLVERYREQAYRLAWSMLQDADEARDLSQEAFIRLYQSAGSFDGRARFSTWFHRILVNLCLDHMRRNRGWRRLLRWSSHADKEDDELNRLASPEPGPEERTARGQLIGRLRAAIDGLSDRQRAAMLLSVQEGLASSEIAAVLKCSESTARVHIHRALMELKKTLKGD